MKKSIVFLSLTCILLFLSGFSFSNEPFNIEELYDYQKAYVSQEVEACNASSVKTYMDYRATTNTASRQYWYIHNKMTVDDKTGLLYDSDGFIGVALGSFYGVIGDRYYFTLDSGIVLPLVKVEEKADADTDESGCYHLSDGSVIEFVIDRNKANDYFGRYGNGLVLSGNFNNYSVFKGNIIKVEKVTSQKNEKYVTYEPKKSYMFNNLDIFFYGSGY